MEPWQSANGRPPASRIAHPVTRIPHPASRIGATTINHQRSTINQWDRAPCPPCSLTKNQERRTTKEERTIRSPLSVSSVTSVAQAGPATEGTEPTESERIAHRAARIAHRRTRVEGHVLRREGCGQRARTLVNSEILVVEIPIGDHIGPGSANRKVRLHTANSACLDIVVTPSQMQGARHGEERQPSLPLPPTIGTCFEAFSGSLLSHVGARRCGSEGLCPKRAPYCRRNDKVS